jgi:predicted MFS family arabinose efflux permease
MCNLSARRVAVDLTVLRESRDLRLVVIGEAISGLGTQAALVAIPYQVYVLTHSAALVGLLGVVELGPLVAASLLGGAAADRVDRRRVLLLAQVVVALVAGALALAAALGPPPVWVVFLLAGALAGASAIDNVTRAAVVPTLAGPLRLRPALSITFGLNQVCAVVGPGIGGLLIAAWGVGSAYAVETAGFLITLAITALLKPMPAQSDEEHPPVLRSIAEGLRFVRRNRALVGSFAIDLAAMTFGMPRALFAVLALTVYDAGAAGTGLLYASVSAGATIAALTTGWLEHANRLGRIVIGAVCVWGLAIAAAGLVPSLWIAAGLLAVAGAADSVSAVCRSTINQTVTPDAMRGRMSSVFMLVVTSGPRLGDLEAGMVASLSTAAFAVTSGGLACLAAVVVIVFAFPELAAYDGRQAAVP